MSYTYGACCCSSGWYDVYWPGQQMAAQPSLFARTSNSAQFNGDDNSHPGAWSVALTVAELDGTWESMGFSDLFGGSVAVVNSDYDSERVWVNYVKMNDTQDTQEVAVLLDCENQTELGVWLEDDYSYSYPATRFPFRHAGTGIVSGDVMNASGGGIFPNWFPRFWRLNNRVITAGGFGFEGMQIVEGVNQRIGQNLSWDYERYTLNDDGTHDYLRYVGSDFLPVSGGGGIQPNGFPTTPLWSATARCHAVSPRYWPKAAGVRTVWNTTPTAEDGSYDFDIDIVYGEISGSAVSLLGSVDGVLKTFNFSGTSTYNSSPARNKDVAWFDADCPLAWVTGYIEDHAGNRAVRYYFNNSGTINDIGATERLEFNGTELIADCSNVTLTESDGVTTHTNYRFTNMQVFTPRGTFPSDNSDRIVLAMEYTHNTSGIRSVQLCSADGTSLRDYIGGGGLHYQILAAGSDAYAYVGRLPGNNRPFYMVRLDNAFEFSRSGEPKAPALSYTSPEYEAYDCVRLTDLDEHTPPLVESELT